MSEKTRIVGIYSVLDKIAVEYGPPFLAVNDGAAVRSFHRMFKDAEGIERNDYELRRVGDFDILSGYLVGLPPETIVTGIAAVKKVFPNSVDITEKMDHGAKIIKE